MEVIKWYREKCEGKTPKPIPPWYNGFTGKMKIINRHKGNVIVEGDDEELEEEFLPGDVDSSKPLSSPKRLKDLSEDELEELDQDSLAVLGHAKHSKITLKTFGKYEITGVHKNEGPIIKVRLLNNQSIHG